MILKELLIRRSEWETGKPLNGNITFIGARGEVRLVFGEEISQKLLDVVADQLVATAKSLATDLTANIITQASAALEKK